MFGCMHFFKTLCLLCTSSKKCLQPLYFTYTVHLKEQKCARVPPFGKSMQCADNHQWGYAFISAHLWCLSIMIWDTLPACNVRVAWPLFVEVDSAFFFFFSLFLSLSLPLCLSFSLFFFFLWERYICIYILMMLINSVGEWCGELRESRLEAWMKSHKSEVAIT